MSNLLIVHGGGPTAVMNCSLYGALREAKDSGAFTHIYGAANGTGGILAEDFICFDDADEKEMELLKQTPGSAIGTSRDQLETAEYEKMVSVLEKYGIDNVLFNGGNGTMDTCGKLYKTAVRLGKDIRVMGIPKTTDNDIAITDHSPGFASAARFIAQSTRELAADVRSLPIHVVVMEASGRNAGWITASSMLADDGHGLKPDLIYLPEVPFDEEKFIRDVDELLKTKSGILVVCSEGLHDAEGKPIVEPIFKVGRATYFGDVSSHLANLVIKKLGYKARGEKPGLLGRCSIMMQAESDAREAEIAGREACRALLAGETGKMVAFRRVSSEPYEAETFLVDIDEVMMFEKTMPKEFINEEGNGVTQAFLDWLKPLVGELTPMKTYNPVRPAKR